MIVADSRCRGTTKNGAAGQDDDAADIAAVRSVQQAQASQQVCPPIPLHIIALAAAIKTGKVIVGGVHEDIRPLQQRVQRRLRVQVALDPGDGEAKTRSVAPGTRQRHDVAALAGEAGGDEAADDPARAGQRNAHGTNVAGSVRDRRRSFHARRAGPGHRRAGGTAVGHSHAVAGARMSSGIGRPSSTRYQRSINGARASRFG